MKWNQTLLQGLKLMCWKFTSFRATACSAECQQLLSKEEESHKESLHPSTLMVDSSEPHESTAFAEYDDFESAYAARVNELESFLRSCN